MDKIRTLLEQLGGSPALVDQIIESLNAYTKKTDETVKEDYKQRLAKAKEACLEEVATYKRELARKMQIFFESRVEKIEQQIAKQAAIKDSAAEAKLQQIVALLEGVEVNGESNNAELQAAKKQVVELQEQVKKLGANNKVLAEKANRALSVADKTLERNKVLSLELAEAVKKQAAPIAESKKEPAPKAKAISESRKRTAPAVTTRRVSDEQLAKAKPAQPNSPQPQNLGGFNPESIAATMD
jgi:hypothetical protein